MVRLDGRRCIGLEIYKEARYNTIDAAEEYSRTTRDVCGARCPGTRSRSCRTRHGSSRRPSPRFEQTGLDRHRSGGPRPLRLPAPRSGVTAVVSIGIPISIVATFSLMYFGDLSSEFDDVGGAGAGGRHAGRQRHRRGREHLQKAGRAVLSLTEAADRGHSRSRRCHYQFDADDDYRFSADRLPARRRR